ncbi:MAG: hypothetical protein NZ772_09090 [Cyanobacteria bacterium]|nr:hypothetical protein [Cyanobacteriota bacterium]MDW8201622.1 KGK domain-containing protein [Cyanobacteriota bacterium SKYGB_h_bin112]
MTDSPKALLPIPASLTQLTSFLGTPKKATKLNPDDVLCKHSGSSFGDLSRTFMVDELLNVLVSCIPACGQFKGQVLLSEGIPVNITSGGQSIRGLLKLELEFYPEEIETIEILSPEASGSQPETPELKLKTLNFREFFSKFSYSYFSSGFFPRVEGVPVNMLRPGSSGWQAGVVRLDLKFYPDSTQTELLGSSLDEIRKLAIADT